MYRTKRTFTILSLILALVVSVAPVSGAAQPSDVPVDHWAYSAVIKLVDLGYLPLDEQLAFRGDQPVDRYTLASIVARILDSIADGQIGSSDSLDERTLQRLI